MFNLTILFFMAMKFPITMCQLSLRVFWVDAGEDVAGAYGLVLVSHKDTKAQRVSNGSGLFVSLCETTSLHNNGLPHNKKFNYAYTFFSHLGRVISRWQVFLMCNIFVRSAGRHRLLAK